MKYIVESWSRLVESPTLISLCCLIFLCNCITIFDSRYIRAKKIGEIPGDAADLPKWVIVFHLLEWTLKLSLLIVDWKVGLIALFIFYVLNQFSSLPEWIGKLIISPFFSKVG